MNIIASCVGGVIAFVWLAYYTYRIVQYCKWKAQKDKRRVLVMQASDAPAQLEHPILQRIVACIAFTKTSGPDQEIRTLALSNTVNQNDALESVTEPATYIGRGAYMVSPAGFVDLEANTHSDIENRKSEKNSVSELQSVEIVNKSEKDDSIESAVLHNNPAKSSSESSQSESNDDDVSPSEKSSSSSECGECESSEESYFSSDRSNVVYSLSSDGVSDVSGTLEASNGENGSSYSDSDSHSYV